MLQRQGNFVNVYFPPDGNSTLAVLHRCLSSTREINIVVAGKTLEPRWRTIDEAMCDIDAGVSVWNFASHEDPHVVFAASGDYLVKESLAAIHMLRRDVPELRTRFVSIIALSPQGLGHSHTVLNRRAFDEHFTTDKPVIFNFHGYPQTIKQILFDYGYSAERFSIRGYEENGSTTTPFDMHVRNGTDRFNLAIDALGRVAEKGLLAKDRVKEVCATYRARLEHHALYIMEHGVDEDDIENWQWTTSQ
jgi:xylulose-5-phosphate/fructose-6-phosphate phosphoketolase